MPVWTKADYEAYKVRRGLSHPKPQPAVCDDALGTPPREAQGPSRLVVSITSVRRRLLDADNLAGGAKYILDGLRYAGLIHGDAPDQITLVVSQRKGEIERTEIELT